MNIFEVTGEKTSNICFLIDALNAVPPTSIESEMAFYVVDIFKER